MTETIRVKRLTAGPFASMVTYWHEYFCVYIVRELFGLCFFFFFPAKTLTWHPAIQSPPMSMSSSSCTLHIGDFMACLAHMKATICKSNQELSLKISVTSCCMMMLSFYHRASTWRFEYLK
jgi:hypothetical protein